MRKKQRTIAAREIGEAELKSLPALTDEELREILDHSTLTTAGLSEDLTDHEWYGGAEKVDINAIVANGLFLTSPLEDVILAIIDGYDAALTPRRKQILGSRNERLNSVIKSLTGKKPRKRDYDKERKFTRVAQRYFKGALCLTSDKDKFLDGILLEEFFSKKGKHSEDSSSSLKRIRREFEANRHRLLIKVSHRGAEEAHAGKVQLGRIVKELNALGIPARIENPA